MQIIKILYFPFLQLQQIQDQVDEKRKYVLRLLPRRKYMERHMMGEKKRKKLWNWNTIFFSDKLQHFFSSYYIVVLYFDVMKYYLHGTGVQNELKYMERHMMGEKKRKKLWNWNTIFFSDKLQHFFSSYYIVVLYFDVMKYYLHGTGVQNELMHTISFILYFCSYNKFKIVLMKKGSTF